MATSRRAPTKSQKKDLPRQQSFDPSSQPRYAMKMTNPLADPAEFERLRPSLKQDTTWKYIIIEAQSWDGTAEENVAKWTRIMGGEEMAPEESKMEEV